MTTYFPLQCQREAARFAAGTTRVDEIRRTTNQEAIRMLVLGRRDEALRVLFDGLRDQAPLSFKPPAVVTVIDADGIDLEVAR